ncbi:MAG: carbohydrate ABC transporter permease [Clostridia bacterium]|nr:carbohydrate ABC transporter permease [Clostridia bacterium]
MDRSRRSVLLKKRLLKAGSGLLRTIFLLGVGYVTLYPMLFMISSSFMSVSDTLDATVVWLPSGMNWFNYQKAFELMDYSASMLNTVSIVLPCVILQVISSVFIAYGFARFKVPGLSVLFAILLFNIIVPAGCYILPVYVLMSDLGLLGSIAQFYIQAILGVGIRSALYIFIIRQFFRTMPKELEEAAFIDGCNPFQTFIRIMVPNVKPAILTVSVLSLVWYYNDTSVLGMLINDIDKNPLSLALYEMPGKFDGQFQNLVGQATLTGDLKLLRGSILAAACLIMVLPITAIYILVQKHFTEGIERTGIVG